MTPLVYQVGWLFKRTRKQANWTNWLKRWFILTPTGLTYYESDKCKAKKGEVVIDTKTTIESLEDFSSFTKKLTCRYWKFGNIKLTLKDLVMFFGPRLHIFHSHSLMIIDRSPSFW